MEIKNFDDLWKMIEDKNPQLQSGKVSMSSDSFKKALQLAWDQGTKTQKEFDKGLMDLMKMGQSAGNANGNANYGDIFSQMFGGGFGKK